MIHRATRRFWDRYWALPEQTRELADKSFALLREDPRHPSLHFKRVGRFWSIRVGARHRALAVPDGDDTIWVWIGSHDDYERMISNR